MPPSFPQATAGLAFHGYGDPWGSEDFRVFSVLDEPEAAARATHPGRVHLQSPDLRLYWRQIQCQQEK